MKNGTLDSAQQGLMQSHVVHALDRRSLRFRRENWREDSRRRINNYQRAKSGAEKIASLGGDLDLRRLPNHQDAVKCCQPTPPLLQHVNAGAEQFPVVTGPL